jgi:hypothetical protein
MFLTASYKPSPLKHGVRLFLTGTSTSILLMGCMYPGMDTNYDIGLQATKVLEAQVAHPENADKNSGKVLSHTDGEKGSLILENHRRDVSTAEEFNQPVQINIKGN